MIIYLRKSIESDVDLNAYRRGLVPALQAARAQRGVLPRLPIQALQQVGIDLPLMRVLAPQWPRDKAADAVLGGREEQPR